MDGGSYSLSASHDICCIVDRYSINRCHHQTQQGTGARRGIGTIEDRMQCGSVPAWDAAGVLYSVSALVKTKPSFSFHIGMQTMVLL